MKIYQIFLELAEKMTGQPITGQFPKDVLWLISLLFSFWLLVLVALMPLAVIKWVFGLRKER